jgi:hypothetical protein
VKAVREATSGARVRNVQETTRLGEMIYSFHRIFSGEADDLDEVAYLHRLK